MRRGGLQEKRFVTQSSNDVRKAVKPAAGIGCFLLLVAVLTVAAHRNCEPLLASSSVSTAPDPKPGHAVSSPKGGMTAHYALSDIRRNKLFRPSPVIRGKIKETEISGIAASHQRKYLFWGLQDSGNGSLLYLYEARNAKLLATFHLESIDNNDWEELQSLSDDAGKHYLIIADTGSNWEAETGHQLFILEEPPIKRSPKTINLQSDITTFNLRYPDSPRNCEAFIVDPGTHALYLFSKELYETHVYYSDKFSLKEDRTDTLQLLGTLPLTMIVAADISDDGNEILLKSYHRIYYWRKDPGASLRETLFEAPHRLPYKPIELKGESICWYNKNYLTLSEEGDAVLYEYRRRRSSTIHSQRTNDE